MLATRNNFGNSRSNPRSAVHKISNQL